MRKRALVDELKRRGLDPTGLTVPQLRTKLRALRRAGIDEA